MNLLDRPKRIVERLREQPLVKELIAVMDSYGRAGGGLLAGGLTFSALFTLTPALMLILGIVGMVISDPDRKTLLVELIAEAIPPLAPFVDTVLVEVANGAVSISLLGLAILIWGASGFFRGLEGSIGRIFSGDRPRDVVLLHVRSIVAVLLIIGAFLASTVGIVVLSWIGPLIALGESGLILDPIRLIQEPWWSALAFIGTVAVCYRAVPPRRLRWRDVGLPAVVVGLVTWSYTAVFVIVQPRLIGSLTIYGSLVAVFGLLIWLYFMFEALLVGAAWLERRTATTPPALDSEAALGTRPEARPATTPETQSALMLETQLETPPESRPETRSVTSSETEPESLPTRSKTP